MCTGLGFLSLCLLVLYFCFYVWGLVWLLLLSWALTSEIHPLSCTVAVQSSSALRDVGLCGQTASCSLISCGHHSPLIDSLLTPVGAARNLGVQDYA